MTKEKDNSGKIKRPTVKEYLKERLRHIPTTVVMSLFILFCLGSSIYFMILGGDRLRDMGFSFAFIVLVLLFYVIEYALNVRVPIGYTALFILFMVFNFAGAVYNLYTIIPCLDDILHAAWGIVFSVMGIMLAKVLIGAPKTAKAVIAYVLFGFGFAMLTSVIWEIYEFTGDTILHSMDMQQDTVVKHFHSFLLYSDPVTHKPDNLHTVEVDGIIKTIIQYGDGQELVIDGYLDLGLFDTMYDIIFCFVATVVFSVALAADWCTRKYFYRFMVPALAGEKYDKYGKPVEAVAAVEEEPEQPKENK